MNIIKKLLLLSFLVFNYSLAFSLDPLVQNQIEAFYNGNVKTISLKIEDKISVSPINIELLKVFKDKKLLGFARVLATTTGCNSACLPLNYITFYGAGGKFLKLISKDGLTKVGHAPFSVEDYSNLEFILVMAPKVFDKIIHPKELTDALSGATLKKYESSVVKGAAYSTLRIHLYNQNTQNIIKSLIPKL
jgi:hypothetical protein